MLLFGTSTPGVSTAGYAKDLWCGHKNFEERGITQSCSLRRCACKVLLGVYRQYTFKFFFYTPSSWSLNILP